MEYLYSEDHMGFNTQKTDAIYFTSTSNSIYFNYHTPDIVILCKIFQCYVQDWTVFLDMFITYLLKH